MDVVLGTSAGSVGAALLGCGLSLEVICRHHQGIALPDDPPIAYDYESTGDALPPRPGWRPASPRLAMDGLRHPRRVSPIMALSGLVPAGRGSLAPVRELVGSVATSAGFDRVWPQAPRPWIVAADYRTGRRVIFGRDDLAAGPDGHTRIVRKARLADAVQASCSIPGWYPPTVIDGVPYIDGGAVSNTSLDALRTAAVDEVYVFAPMASIVPDQPRTMIGRLERRVRRVITRRIVADATALRAQGVKVCIVTPGPADLEAMGVNLMDPGPRLDVLTIARDTATAQLRRQLTASDGWARPRLGLARDSSA
jgi:NTE family protein